MRTALTIIGTILLFIAICGGLMMLLIWDTNNDAVRYEEKCAQVAKLSGVTEYKVDYSTCYLLKDGKIEVVK